MKRKRILAVPVAALLVGGGGWATYAATAGADASYRTATTVVGSVDQTIDLSGTVSPTGRADLAFGSGGEVARVYVAEGDRVRAGGLIAVLDRRELRATLATARSDLAAAKAQLATDEDAQAEAVTEASDTGAQSTSSQDSSAQVQVPDSGGVDEEEPAGDDWDGEDAGSDPPADDSSSAALEAALAGLAAEQDAVTTAQSAASAAIVTADDALASQQQACAIAEETPTDGETDGAAGGVTDECTQALAAVQSAQAAVSDAQASLQASLESLGGTLDVAVQVLAQAEQTPADDPAQPEQEEPEQEQSAPAQSGQGQGQAVQQAEATSPSTEAAGAGTSESAAPGGTMATTVTAATLAQDQASIDQAEVGLLTAKAAMTAAVVRAPAASKVVSLTVEAGDTVAAGAAAAVVVGKGLTTVDVEVSASQAGQMEVGQGAQITPAGSEEPLGGTVTRIEKTPVEEESTDAAAFPLAASTETKYPVTVTLDETDLTLASGMPADVTITVGQVTDALTVPTSAVSDGSVTVVEDGTTSQVQVTTGIVGATRTEIVDGLEAGTEVVLADLAADLPSGGSSDAGSGGGSGGFSGEPPQGFPG